MDVHRHVRHGREHGREAVHGPPAHGDHHRQRRDHLRQEAADGRARQGDSEVPGARQARPARAVGARRGRGEALRVQGPAALPAAGQGHVRAAHGGPAGPAGQHRRGRELRAGRDHLLPGRPRMSPRCDRRRDGHREKSGHRHRREGGLHLLRPRDQPVADRGEGHQVRLGLRRAPRVRPRDPDVPLRGRDHEGPGAPALERHGPRVPGGAPDRGRPAQRGQAGALRHLPLQEPARGPDRQRGPQA
mmetsp:Transcript_78853/g.206993  ORF Transcript_78853/g.206993 Transcript_78853/m.206993 type:complete len:246 (-) Transcript_78853:726-1463(-)